MNISAVRSHVPLMDRLVQADLASVQILEGAITLEIDLAQDASGQLKELYDKFLESRAKLMDEARRSHKWGWLQKFIGFVQSIASIFAGAAAVATGAGAGAGVVLVINGIFGLTNESLKVSGAYEKWADKLAGGDTEKRDRIIMKIDMGTTYGCLAISLVSAGAVGFGSLGDGARNAINATTDVVAAATAITSIGKGVTTARRMTHQANCYEIGWEIRLGEMEAEQLRAQAAELLGSLEAMMNSSADGIEGFRRLSQIMNKA